MTTSGGGYDEDAFENVVAEDPSDVPDWDDEYVDRVSDRIMFSYDLEKDYRVRGERFALYGKLHVDSHKQFFHHSLQFGHHYSEEHLFVRRAERVTEGDLEALVELGHHLAEERIDPDEEHYVTEFTFAVVVSDFDESVERFVEGFRDRTLLKKGYYGHYEVNLIVVAPEHERAVASEQADVARAFRLWEPVEEPEPGLLDRIVRWIWR